MRAATVMTGDSDSDCSPVTTVFGTPELLEMILLIVAKEEAKTALLSQRVSKAFRETVQGSEKLLGFLFTHSEGVRQLLGPYLRVIKASDGDLTTMPIRLANGIHLKVAEKVYGQEQDSLYYHYELYNRLGFQDDKHQNYECSWRRIVLPRVNRWGLLASARFDIDVCGWRYQSSKELVPQGGETLGYETLRVETVEGVTLGDVVAELLAWSKGSMQSITSGEEGSRPA